MPRDRIITLTTGLIDPTLHTNRDQVSYFEQKQEQGQEQKFTEELRNLKQPTNGDQDCPELIKMKNKFHRALNDAWKNEKMNIHKDSILNLLIKTNIALLDPSHENIIDVQVFIKEKKPINSERIRAEWQVYYAADIIAATFSLINLTMLFVVAFALPPAAIPALPFLLILAVASIWKGRQFQSHYEGLQPEYNMIKLTDYGSSLFSKIKVPQEQDCQAPSVEEQRGSETLLA